MRVTVGVIDVSRLISYLNHGLRDGQEMLCTEVHLVIKVFEFKRGLYPSSRFISVSSVF